MESFRNLLELLCASDFTSYAAHPTRHLSHFSWVLGKFDFGGDKNDLMKVGLIMSEDVAYFFRVNNEATTRSFYNNDLINPIFGSNWNPISKQTFFLCGRR